MPADVPNGNIGEGRQRPRATFRTRPEHAGKVPMCMLWPIPEPGMTMWDWQNGECAICGLVYWADRLVLDHDHTTGLDRGYLCRSCNAGEGHAVGPMWTRYRAGWNPATITGHFDVYYGPFTGDPVMALHPAATPAHRRSLLARMAELGYEIWGA